MLNVKIDRDDNSGSLCITCPDTVHGEIRLPDGWKFENGEASLPLASGCYKICR